MTIFHLYTRHTKTEKKQRFNKFNQSHITSPPHLDQHSHCGVVSSPDPPEKWKEGLVFLVTFLVTWGGAYGTKINIKMTFLHPGLEFSDGLDFCTVWFTKA